MYVGSLPRVTDPGPEAAQPPRVYEAWPGSNIFFLQGRLIFGPDVRSLFLTIFLIVAPVSIFCVFIARNLMDAFSHHVGISIIVIAVAFTIYDLMLLLLTSGRDPGIIPRNVRPPELKDNAGDVDIGGDRSPEIGIPRVKDVTVRGITVKIKYCDTCMLYRPPRCSHCSICDNCVERFDHHCPWVGQCIGMRNYRFFYMFVFSTTLLCMYVFAFCWVYIVKIMDAHQTTIWKAMAKTPASIVLIIYTFISVWFVGGLSVFHFYLISTNQTTYENFRYRYDRRANPYYRGVVGNFKEIFFSSIPPSKNKFRVRRAVEQGSQAQPAGGGFVSPNMGKVIRNLEMSRKPVTWDETMIKDLEAGMGNEMPDDKDGVFSDASSDFNRTTSSEGLEGRAAWYQRRSSWVQRSGSREVSPQAAGVADDVAKSNG